MIISRTPYRVSFFGGGTDYPVWFQEHGGAVLATTIDKYCYITCRYLPPFFEHRSRIVYSRVEHVQEPDQIQHPAVRESLRYLGITDGVEIHHDGDLPARAGLGTSSSFVVGLLHTLYALKGAMPSKLQLALDAITIEQERLRENVGCQDQTLAAIGGFNLVEFGGPDVVRVRPVTVTPARLRALESNLMLFFTGFSRTASEIAAEQIRQTPNRARELEAMQQMVYEGLSILCGAGDLTDFGTLLDEAWRLKRSLTDTISTATIDDMYAAARSAGAAGGKLLGAGGGGFLLVFAEPAVQPRVRERLRNLLEVPFRFEDGGSQIIFYSPQENVAGRDTRVPAPSVDRFEPHTAKAAATRRRR
jgi:D-glycero-alpha-D-manno-heptose-7-phosphate kinase